MLNTNKFKDYDYKELDCYNSIQGLRKSGLKIKLTKQQAEEYVKCATDIDYFLTNYYVIVSLDKGEMLFDPYDFQLPLVHHIKDNRFSITLAARQTSKSTCVIGVCLYELLFKDSWNINYCGNKAEIAIELLGRLKLAYERLPFWLQKGVKIWNEKRIKLENGSQMKALATTASSGRGGSVNRLCLDEFAFVERRIQLDFMASSMPSISSGKTTMLTIYSTPNGNEEFYRIYKDTELHKNNFKLMKIIWSDIKSRDDKWKNEMIQLIGLRKFKVEHECDFEGSTSTVIPKVALDKIIDILPIYTTNLSQTNPFDTYKVYQEPCIGHTYWIGVDPGEGLGQDYTTFQVIDITSKPYIQCAVWKANDINTITACTKLKILGEKYNNAIIAIENNGIGSAMSMQMWNAEDYENLIFTQKKDKFHRTHLLLGCNLVGSKIGIVTTNKTKIEGTERLSILLEQNNLIINDTDTKDELSHFIKVRNTYQAEDGFHDDLVMPLVLFAYSESKEEFGDFMNNGSSDTNMEDEQPIAPVHVDPFSDPDGWIRLR